ncbi:MAG: BREX-1 system adenine-specific DNA-methyltransferase PglX [Bacillota bacterium]|nr:BREX-1 system adenine-specific DNA-methyltransferase PglX [Bacillota bacterium]
MNKTAIKNFAVWARRKLIAEITYKAGRYGVTEDGIVKVSEPSKGLQVIPLGKAGEVTISGSEITQRNALVNAVNAKAKELKYKEAFEYVIEEVAYTWFNRLIALRFMEVNDYLPSRVRVLSSENPAKAEPDFVTNPFDTDLEFTSYEQDLILQLKDQNKLDELFRMLFIKQCNKLHDILPGLFEKTDDYTELLLTISFTDQDGVIWHLIHDIDEKDFNIETIGEDGKPTGQIEIIGWLYQYYNTEPKDKVFANLKKNIKISKENIPAATQLFTPDWIVRYMVENSLGRLWVEGHPNDDLKSNWNYYLEEAEQEADVQKQLAAIRKEYAELTPEDIKCIDPCMGSGHILVYMFDVLMQIYESYGYTQRDAARLIVEKNLYGLDIDKRAYQLSYFAVMMKARQYNRRILNGELTPNVFAIQDSSALTQELIDFIANGDRTLKTSLQSIKDDLKDATEYGSILDVTAVNFERIYARLEEIESTFYDDIIGQLNQKLCLEVVYPLLRQADAMAAKYWTVCTNPPYMGASGMSPKLNDLVKVNYPDSKSDLFAVFIEKCSKMLRQNGYQAMITQHAWMFLTSYEKLRMKLQTICIVNMAHLGARAFEEIGGEVVQTTSFVFGKREIKEYIGVYQRLIEPTTQQGKENLFLAKEQQFYAKQGDYKKIPGAPVAYWVNNSFLGAFDRTKIADIASPKSGMTTTDNNRFLRLWHEVVFTNIGFSYSDIEQTVDCKYKWFPFCKGGEFRRWYGNTEYVVNWFGNGIEIRKAAEGASGGRLVNVDIALQKGLVWSKISSGKISFRWKDEGIFFSDAAPEVVCCDNDKNYLLGLLNSPCTQYALNIINPTLNYVPGAVASVPYIIDDEKKDIVNYLVGECISIVKNDWDSYEGSWDFRYHPLVPSELLLEWKSSQFASDRMQKAGTISWHFANWNCACDENFERLKKLEEELNQIFIESYGLSRELSYEVDDEDVSVRRADLQREIKSLISYAVGCMFGRYSLDTEGLIYAGGKWESSKYSSFIPDADNCIPITDEEYFEDDIVGLFCAWLKKVYGAETLEENLDFIAAALGNKGSTSREVIRNYFLNDFMKDHLKIYQKRPIYWLFDSGKQNGFKTLVYMHRWNADTIGNVRVEYLHRIQRVYEKEIERMQDVIDHSSGREASQATKRKEKLVKQLKECKEYDELVAHLALCRIDIDLDDGVKVNYEKVQTGQDGKKLQILTKI